MSSSPLLRAWRRAATALITGSLVVGSITLAGPATASTPAPRTPSGLPSAIEPMAAYVPQVSCDPRIGPGTRKLANYLANTYRASTRTTWMSFYPCGTDGTPSEHSDGRAIDWMVNVRDPKQRAAANATIAWLLATDSHGNRYAMARRLGVMYLIWNNRIWGSWGGGWSNYNGCLAKSMQKAAYANACHRTHIHISLGWAGAQGRTSFWTKKVAAQDFGPCRARDLNWGPRYYGPRSTPCPQYAKARAPKGATSTKKALVTWSGAWLGRSSSGPAVVAVRRALHLSSSSSYGSSAVAAVERLQRAHHLPVTGAMNQNTWRALLTATR
ncbi:peptidoglycan-binding protein [uncultured Jatrophihabitans sp.]|uniref:peptidoglycan-binding domain-containing protein n=1 Tax=uncultured Jatrophihabitans sp. TaxID=1610747 RepID=UPI0035CBE3F2